MVLKKIVTIGTVMVVIFISTPALAESTTNREAGPKKILMGMMRPEMRPAVIGSVTAINGTTITLKGRMAPGNNATSTYSVDASNAKVFMERATSTVSSIKTGDMIFVEGVFTGTNIVATNIRDGVKGVGFGPGKREDHASSTPAFTGNGQPLVLGKISAVNGNTLTITTGNGVIYTVDATGAKILKGKDASTLSNVVVGDHAMIQGAVNGTSIVATTIIEQPQRPANNDNQKPPQGHGLLGGFLMHLFGF